MVWKVGTDGYMYETDDDIEEQWKMTLKKIKNNKMVCKTCGKVMSENTIVDGFSLICFYCNGHIL